MMDMDDGPPFVTPWLSVEQALARKSGADSGLKG